MSCTASGPSIQLTYPIGDDNASFNWHHEGPPDEAAKDRLPVHITDSTQLNTAFHTHRTESFFVQPSSFQERVIGTVAFFSVS
jgi:hypothetical protein